MQEGSEKVFVGVGERVDSAGVLVGVGERVAVVVGVIGDDVDLT
jgi:hypothetical protein